VTERPKETEAAETLDDQRVIADLVRFPAPGLSRVRLLVFYLLRVASRLRNVVQIVFGYTFGKFNMAFAVVMNAAFRLSGRIRFVAWGFGRW
jgi:hypothetical protein